MQTRFRYRPVDAAILLPAAVGSAGLGVAAGEAPLVAAGVGGATLLALMPWEFLFVLLAAAASLNRFRFDIASVTLQPAHLVIVPLAVRVFVLGKHGLGPRWRLPEYALLGFLGLQFLASMLFALDPTKSLLSAGLLALGVLAYFTTYSAVRTPRRLLFAARVMLVAALVGSAVGVLALISFLVAGTHFGVSVGSRGVAINGFALEHNIYGSFSAAAAIAFLVLMREDNPVFSRRFAAFGFWVCVAGTLASLTRSAWIAFGAVALLLLVLRSIRRRPRNRVRQFGLISLGLAVFALGLLGAIVTGSATIVSGQLAEKGATLLEFGEGSGEARLNEWKTAAADWTKSPIIGLGTNSYGQRHLAPQKGPNTPESERVGYLGNLYIRTGYDSGLLGLFFLLVFLALVLWPGLVLHWSPHPLAPVARAFILGYAVMAIAFAGTDASLQLWPWIFAGLARAAASQVMARTVALSTRPSNGQVRVGLARPVGARQV